MKYYLNSHTKKIIKGGKTKCEKIEDWVNG